MATLNITTAKTRAQMIVELTNWADATNQVASDRVWVCSDNIIVTANVEIYGLTLIFASSKFIRANAGGTINVSSLVRGEYSESAIVYLKHSQGSAISLVSGTGKWTGSGLTFLLDTGNIVFSSTTSNTILLDTTLLATGGTDPYINITLSASSNFNIQRSSGVTLRLYGGNLSMNPKGIGAVSGRGFGSVKLLANSSTFHGFIINASAAFPIQTSSTTFNANTMTFIDGKIDPVLIHGYPGNNTGVVRLMKRTVTLLPVAIDRSPISSFKYRVSSNRVIEPASTTTNNFTIVTNQSGNTNDTYLLTVFRGAGTSNTGATYKSLTNLTIDKDMRVQYRKYGLKEATFSSNSYNFAVDAPAIMQVDTYVKETNAATVAGWVTGGFTKAHQFYDVVRYIAALDFTIPDDLLITDGETLTIKTGWELIRSANSADITTISNATKKITIKKTATILKDDTGIWKYNTILGSVGTSISGHTDLAYERTDGKAVLYLSITCPSGSKDPVVAIWPFSQGLDNRANLITGQGTGIGVRNVTLLVDATVKYYCIAKALGANLYRPFAIDPVGGLGATVPITLFVYEKADGTPLFPDTLTPAQTAVADTLDFHGTHIDVKIPTDFASNARWSATDKIWQYKVDDFIAIAYKLDVIQTALTLSVARNQLIFIREGMLLISAAADDKILEQDPANKTTVSSTTNVKVSFTTISIGRIGDTDARNTFIDDVNGTIDVRGGVPINGGFPLGAETKINETYQRLALDSAKPLTSKPDGGITSIGITITATELADGSVVQTRGT